LFRTVRAPEMGTDTEP